MEGRHHTITSRWMLRSDTITEKPRIDPVVNRWLFKLLVQYAESSGDTYLQRRFKSDGVISLGNLKVLIQDNITIGGGYGAFEGFETFTIHATSSFGTGQTPLQDMTGQRRERYDLVEVTIPIECQGNIAGNKHLLRTSDEFAVAQVRAIVVLKLAYTEVPLLFLMFLRKGYANNSSNCPRGISKETNKRLMEYIPKLSLVEYGCPVKEWLALYPIVTLKAPVLGVKDSTQPGFFHVFPLRYLSRENWFDQNLHPEFEIQLRNMLQERLSAKAGELQLNDERDYDSLPSDLDLDEEDSLADLDDDDWE